MRPSLDAAGSTKKPLSCETKLAAAQPHFLVVDDEPLVARSMARDLARFGEVTTAVSAQQAVEVLQHRPTWSGFVIDLWLPDGSGLNLLRVARQRFQLVPAILLSGAMDSQGINGAFALGAKCLCKPWPPRWCCSR